MAPAPRLRLAMHLPHPPSRRPALLLAAFFAGAAAFALLQTDDQSAPPAAVGPNAVATLVVDGVDYDFELDTCFVGNDSFVVSGHGTQEGQDFRVAASPSEVELAFDIVEEAEPVPEDSLWLGTDEVVTWSAKESSVRATASLAERLGDGTAQHAAELFIDCGITS